MTELTGTARTLMEKLRRVSHILQKDFMRAVSTEFKPSSVMVLMRLWHRKKHGEGGVRVSEFANALGITVPAVTQIVTGLEAQGLVSREIDSEDRRAIRVSLTEKGSDTLIPFFARYSEGFNGLADTLGAADTAELIRLLERVEAHFAETLGLPKDRFCPLEHDKECGPC